MATAMGTVPKLQRHQTQLAAVDQLLQHQPNRVDHYIYSTVPLPKCSQLAHAGTSKGKGGPSSKGGKGASDKLEGVTFRGTFAEVAPSGRVVMSGGTTGLEMP